MDKLWTWLLSGAAILAASATIYFQHQEIVSLKDVQVLNKEKISQLESKITLGIKEKTRLDATIEEYKKQKAEVEVKYITKKVPVFREIVKVETPQAVDTIAKKELNEVYSSISNGATDFSLRNDKN